MFIHLSLESVRLDILCVVIFLLNVLNPVGIPFDGVLSC